MVVKQEKRSPKYETMCEFKILNFQNRSFGYGGPKSELLLKQPSTIGAICVFVSKKAWILDFRIS